MKFCEIFIFFGTTVFLFSISSTEAEVVDLSSRDCWTDNDCPYTEVCYDRSCLDACRVHNGELVKARCGANALCYMTGPHTAACRCYPTHSGHNPDLGCFQKTNFFREEWKLSE